MLAETKEAYLGAMLPAIFAIPEFDGFDDAALAGKIDGVRRTAGRDAIPDQEFLMRAIVEVDKDAVEINSAAIDADLDGAESAIMLADVNAVVVSTTVHVSVAEIVPTLRAQRSTKRQGKDECNGG